MPTLSTGPAGIATGDAAMGAPYSFAAVVPPLAIAILTFPIAAWTASRLDHWRLGQ